MEQPDPAHETATPPPAPAIKRMDAASLFGAAREIELVHQGEPYRLRITRNGRLILTK